MDLKNVKRKLPHSFRYRGKIFTMQSYSASSYKGRSKEIIWGGKRGIGQVYLFEDNIEYIPDLDYVRIN